MVWGCFARNLWGKSFMRCCFARNNSITKKILRIIFNKNLFCVLRVLSVFRGFLVAYGKKSLEEILFKMLLRKK